MFIVFNVKLNPHLTSHFALYIYTHQHLLHFSPVRHTPPLAKDLCSVSTDC